MISNANFPAAVHMPSAQSTLVIGNTQVMEHFSKLIIAKGCSLNIELDPLAQTDDQQLIFGRDARVLGLHKQHLLPYAIQDALLHGIFLALLPSSADPFVINTGSGGYGAGFSKKNAAHALAHASDHNLPYAHMRCTIEGGNCYVFVDASQQPKAIVGLHSLVLSMIGLEEQGYFDAQQAQISALSKLIETPSDDAVRAARNMAHYAPKRDFDRRLKEHRQRQSSGDKQWCQQHTALMKEWDSWGGESGYRQLLAAPVTEQERAQYAAEARIWEAKAMLTRQAIADDLQVPLEAVAFVPQKHFHIDMEMFVAPDGDEVFIDEGSFHAPAIAALEKIGCKVTPLPGIHTVDNQAINFMNGVFVSTPSKPLFVTNGVSRKGQPFAAQFKQSLKQANPGIKVIFMHAHMPEILRINRAGIHCLTWEKAL